jgi:hypothetical protein
LRYRDCFNNEGAPMFKRWMISVLATGEFDTLTVSGTVRF